MKAIHKSEAFFADITEVDFQKNKKLLILINLLSFILFPVFYLFFFYLSLLTGVTDSGNIFYYFKMTGFLPLTGSISFIAALLLVMVIHEFIHGFFFYLFTGAKPVIGFKSVYAYAGAPDWYIKKKYFIVITLSPLILISLSGFLLLFLLNPPYSSIVFLVMTANAAGCAGDIWMSITLSRRPPETYINDTGVSSAICC